MSWLSQFFGIDDQAAQQDAIGRQQEQQQSQMNWSQNQYNDVTGKQNANISGYETAAGKEANYLSGLGSEYDKWGAESMAGFDSSGAEMKAEYQGALQDIYTTGRNQAAGSGLIGGFQEGNNTSPAIAALGRSFTTSMANMKNSIAQQKSNIGQSVLQGKTGLNTAASNLRLSPYAMKNETYGSQAGALAGLYGQSSSGYGQSLGNYAESANPLGNIFGAIGAIGGAAGSIMTGGASAGWWGK